MDDDSQLQREHVGPTPEQIAAEVAAPEQPVAPGMAPPPPRQPQPPPYGGYYRPPAMPTAARGFPWWGWLIGGCLVLALLSVGACAALGFAFGRFASNFASETPAAVSASQSFSVSGVPDVVVNNMVGSVTIQPGSQDMVNVAYTRNARDRSGGQARNDLNSISVMLTQTGNTITVQVNQPAGTSLFSQYSVDLTITVPPSTNLALQVGTGEAHITGTQGILTLTGNVGDAELENVTLLDGSTIKLTTGTVAFSGTLASGANVSISLGTGDVTLLLPATTSTHLDASITFGNLTISGWSIPVQRSATNYSAAGDLSTPATGELRVQVTTGSIELEANT